MNKEHYTYRVRWSAANEACVTVAEIPSLSWAANKPIDAFGGIRADMAQIEETPPEAIADRTYSGKFMVRVPPAPTARHRGGRAEPLIEPARCHPTHRSVKLPL